VDGSRKSISCFYFYLSFAIIKRTAFNDDFIPNAFGAKTMQIKVSLNAGATDAADIRAALDAELHGLEQPDLEITTQKKPIEAGALALAEAYQFILDYGPGLAKALPLVTAVLQLSNAVLQRRGITAKKKPKSLRKRPQRNPSWRPHSPSSWCRWKIGLSNYRLTNRSSRNS
jgi:hypothetical protein